MKRFLALAAAACLSWAYVFSAFAYAGPDSDHSASAKSYLGDTALAAGRIFEQNGLSIDALEIKAESRDQIPYVAFYFLFQNQTGGDLLISIRDFSLNNYVSGYQDQFPLPSGMESSYKICFEVDSLYLTGINEIMWADLSVSAYRSTDSSPFLEQTQVHLETSRKGPLGQTDQPLEQILYDSGGVRVSLDGQMREQEFGMTALKLVENNSGQEICAELHCKALNSFEIDTVHPSVLKPGMRDLSIYGIYWRTMAIYGMTKIESLTLQVVVRDAAGAELGRSGDITVHFR